MFIDDKKKKLLAKAYDTSREVLLLGDFRVLIKIFINITYSDNFFNCDMLYWNDFRKLRDDEQGEKLWSLKG